MLDKSGSRVHDFDFDGRDPLRVQNLQTHKKRKKRMTGANEDFLKGGEVKASVWLRLEQSSGLKFDVCREKLIGWRNQWGAGRLLNNYPRWMV